MAFVRRLGNSFYLVHNVRRAGKVKQLYLACLGQRPSISDEVVRQVSRQHPFLSIDWSGLRERISSRVELFDPRSDYFQNLMGSILQLNLDLAGFSPPVLGLTHIPETSHEMITRLRLLRSTVDVKLSQFDPAPRPGPLSDRRNR